MLQIEVCIDEKAYGTLWTRHFVYGVSIYENDYNVRPDFKVDNYNENRYFNFTDDYGMNQLSLGFTMTHLCNQEV